MKIGDTIKYKCHYIHYKGLGDKNPTQGVDVREVVIVAPSKGTDYESGSDWIVCYPKDYPITDLRSTSNAKHWGISNEQIILQCSLIKYKEGQEMEHTPMYKMNPIEFRKYMEEQWVIYNQT